MTLFQFFTHVELIQVLRYYTYISIESEMTVGDYKFKLSWNEMDEENFNFFKTIKKLTKGKDIQRFINAIRFASFRVSSNFMFYAFLFWPESCLFIPVSARDTIEP
jgi:hypothetical protein